jgi:hypothetical protein
MARHAEDALRCSCITKVFNLALAISTTEAIRAERLVARQNCQILNFVPTVVAAIGTVVADERAIAE